MVPARPTIKITALDAIEQPARLETPKAKLDALPIVTDPRRTRRRLGSARIQRLQAKTGLGVNNWTPESIKVLFVSSFNFLQATNLISMG